MRRNLMTVCLYGSLLAPTAVRAELPASYSVPTPTRALTKFRFVAVDGGKLYEKKTAADEWKLLGTGLPVVEGEPAVAAVTEVSADDERIVARGSDGFLYRFEDGAWAKLWGLPIPLPGFLKPLQLPGDTTQWALSMRLGQVKYYEDRHGNQFNYGAAGCTTVFGLRGDGSRIAMADPWFPPDVSREMCGPDRGTFRAVGLASSASVTFVVNAQGELYTRFFDYDANGGTPFFVYRYDDFPKQPLSGMDPASEPQIRGLPEMPWVEQPRIAQEGSTRLTRRIAVLQDGVGNSARELRVLAVGPTGERGYFTKPLTGEAWTFVATGESIDPSDFIDNDAEKHERGTPRDRAFHGELRLGPSDRRTVLRASIPDFNFHCGPVHLELSLGVQQKFTLNLHTVDSWTLFDGPDPEDDSAAFKSLKVTVEVPDEARNHPDARVRELVETYFAPLHWKSFSLSLVANAQELHLRPVRYPYNLGAPLFSAVLLSGTKVKTRPYSRGHAKLLADTGCVPAKTYKSLVEGRKQLQDRAGFAASLQRYVPLGLMPLDVLSAVTTTRWTWGKMMTLPAFEEHAPALLHAMALAQKLALERSAEDYARVESALRSRVCGE
jgi:hypothetical protein